MPFDTYRDLRVYQGALELCLKVFETTKRFPMEERFGLVDQVRRSSRSVCANLAEAWYKRRYQAAFIAKLNDSESEAAETQVWIDVAHRCGYLDEHKTLQFHAAYDKVLGQLVRMAQTPEKWVIRSEPPSEAKPAPRAPLKDQHSHSLSSPAPQLPSSPARSAQKDGRPIFSHSPAPQLPSSPARSV